MTIYLWDSVDQKYFKVVDKEVFLNLLEDFDFDQLKQIFKMTYQEYLFHNSLKVIQAKGIFLDMGYIMDVSEGVEMFKEYIINRYDENIYHKMIGNFKADYDYKAKHFGDVSILN